MRHPVQHFGFASVHVSHEKDMAMHLRRFCQAPGGARVGGRQAEQVRQQHCAQQQPLHALVILRHKVCPHHLRINRRHDHSIGTW